MKKLESYFSTESDILSTDDKIVVVMLKTPVIHHNLVEKLENHVRKTIGLPEISTRKKINRKTLTYTINNPILVEETTQIKNYKCSFKFDFGKIIGWEINIINRTVQHIRANTFNYTKSPKRTSLLNLKEFLEINRGALNGKKFGI